MVACLSAGLTEGWELLKASGIEAGWFVMGSVAAAAGGGLPQTIGDPLPGQAVTNQGP